MRTLIVDDSKEDCIRLHTILKQLYPGHFHAMLHSPEAALEYLRNTDIDIVFLDIELPSMGGMTMSGKIREISTRIQIVYVTEYPKYALTAYRTYPNGFLLKPVSREEVAGLISTLNVNLYEKKLTIIKNRDGNGIEICAGEKTLHFKRSRSALLLDYLAGQKGRPCRMSELIVALWPGREDDASVRSQLRNLITDLRTTLKAAGVEDLLVKQWNALAVIPEYIETVLR